MESPAPSMLLEHSSTPPTIESRPARKSARESFSALEWSIVALAERSSLASLREPGRIASALASLFGRRDNSAADPRLEALRRVAVFAWHRGWVVPTSELRAFLAAGFSLDQYELLQRSIARGRATRWRKYPA